MSPKAANIIMLNSLAASGIHIDIDELSVEEAHLLAYYGIKKRQKEEENRFKTLFEGLQKLLRFK